MPTRSSPISVQGYWWPGGAEQREWVPRGRGPLPPSGLDFFSNKRERVTAFCPDGKTTGSIQFIRGGLGGIRHRPCRHSIVSLVRRVVATRAPGGGRTLVRGLICCLHQSFQIQWSLL